jgi:hypothetical protein
LRGIEISALILSIYNHESQTMQKAILYLDNGDKKEVFLLDEKDLAKSIEFQKKNWKEHIYIGYLIIGSIAFALGIAISLKLLNGSK